MFLPCDLKLNRIAHRTDETTISERKQKFKAIFLFIFVNQMRSPLRRYLCKYDFSEFAVFVCIPFGKFSGKFADVLVRASAKFLRDTHTRYMYVRLPTFKFFSVSEVFYVVGSSIFVSDQF